MISNLFDLASKDDKSTIVFVLKLSLCIFSPTFCIIFFFFPDLFKKFDLQIISILSCTINSVIILILYKVFSYKIDIIKNINYSIDKDDYKTFIENRKKCINILAKNTLDRACNHIILFSSIIVLEKILYKYIKNILCSIFNDILSFIIFITVILYIIFIIYTKKNLKDSGDKLKMKLESELKKISK